jgi:AraC-like DNA-binding protein
VDQTLVKLTDNSFPVSVIEHIKTAPGALFEAHLHQHHLQFFYFKKGNAQIYYNQTNCPVAAPEILLINKNELHYGENNCPELRYFVFRINLKLLLSYNIVPCSQKYLECIESGLVRFTHHIKSKHVSNLLDCIITEYTEKHDGYEMKIIAYVFDLLGEIFRNHKGETLTLHDSAILMQKTNRFAAVFSLIEKEYTRTITLEEAAGTVYMSKSYFCRMFKQSTGRTLTDYINRSRIEKAALLLNQGMCNVTDAALSVGIEDINYFSRIFKKYMGQSPVNYIHNSSRYLL